MAKQTKFYEKRKNSRNFDANEQAFTNARAVACAFVCDLYLYFNSLPGVVNCDTNADKAPIKFFEFKNKDQGWFGYTLCFEHEGYSFRMYFGFEYDQEKQKVRDHSGEKWPGDVEPIHLYKHVSNYWLQLNQSRTFEPHDGNSTFLVTFDASPHWKTVALYPHHKHTYSNNVKSAGMDFDGTRDGFIDVLQEFIQNHSLSFGPIK